MSEPLVESPDEIPAVDAAADVVDEGGPRATMAAAAALARLRSGGVLENVRVEKLVFSGDFPQGVRLRRCTLVRPRFDGAVFAGKAVFEACTLEKPYFARPSVFAHDLSFSRCTLAAAQIARITVRGAFNCEGVRTRGSFDVQKARFEGTVRFWDAEFLGWVNFKNSEFLGEVDLRSLRTLQGFVLRDCRFLAAVLFRGSSVAMKLDCTGSRFEGLVDFSKAKLNDFVYLEEIEQGPRQQFAFANTLGERILVSPDQLRDRIASELVGDFRQAMHEYAFLKRVYSGLHRYEMEDWAFYRFKVNQRRSCDRSWRRPWTKLAEFTDWLLLDVGCGYCTSPYRALRAALALILGFGLIYALGAEHLQAAKLPFPALAADSLPNRIAVGLLTSVSVFTSGLGSLREPAEGWMNLPLMIESLLGTLLYGLFIVAFSRKVIR